MADCLYPFRRQSGRSVAPGLSMGGQSILRTSCCRTASAVRAGDALLSPRNMSFSCEQRAPAQRFGLPIFVGYRNSPDAVQLYRVDAMQDAGFRHCSLCYMRMMYRDVWSQQQRSLTRIPYPLGKSVHEVDRFAMWNSQRFPHS